jgi:hypothetical protein
MMLCVSSQQQASSIRHQAASSSSSSSQQQAAEAGFLRCVKHYRYAECIAFSYEVRTDESTADELVEDVPRASGHCLADIVRVWVKPVGESKRREAGTVEKQN